MGDATRAWWMDAVVYQIYVRSFADADGDGIGDLAGIRSRVGYLAALGVDAVWLTPCYPSPQYDHGYDVADYFGIEPTYGDMPAFDALVAELRGHGIGVVMDVVPNHCSIDHEWFRAAIAAAPGAPERDRFWIRSGRDAGREAPNNWRAWFGGPAWSPVPDGSGEWYLHQFTPWQPDFNWNNADVVDHFDQVLRFWFDRGVDGFRVDAVIGVGKDPALPDVAPSRTGARDTDLAGRNPHLVFRPEGHVVWRHWRHVIDQYERDHPGRSLFTVSEAYAPRRPDRLAQFARHDEFHQSFSFDLLLAPWHAPSWRRAIDESLRVMVPAGVAPTWALNNHDAQRTVTRYGRANASDAASYTGNNLVNSQAPVDVALGTIRARAAALVLLALPGAAYLYAGEELGLPEVLDIPADRRQDPIFARTNGRELGRDGCRVPLPWTTDPAGSHGFSAAGARPAWMPQPEGWGRWGVAAQGTAGDLAKRPADDQAEGSVLALYRRAIALRRLLVPRDDEAFAWLDVDDGAVAFRRGGMAVVANLGPRPVPVPPGEVVMASGRRAIVDGFLAPDRAVWIRN